MECYRFRLTNDVDQAKRFMPRLLKTINKVRQFPVQFELTFEKIEKENFCIINVPDETELAKMAVFFPFYVHKQKILPPLLNFDIKRGVRHNVTVDTNIDQYVCGYINADYVKGYGQEKLSKDLTEDISNYRAQYYKFRPNASEEYINFSVLSQKVTINGKKYNPVVFNFSPDKLNLKNFSSADFAEAVEKRYSAYYRIVRRFLGREEKDLSYRSDLAGTPIEPTNVYKFEMDQGEKKETTLGA